jgi:hypothetical protein
MNSVSWGRGGSYGVLEFMGNVDACFKGLCSWGLHFGFWNPWWLWVVVFWGIGIWSGLLPLAMGGGRVAS